MASSNEEIILLSWLLVSVLQLADSQIICRIEVDSSLGLWRDVTPTPAPPNKPPNCIGYSYRETSLTCTSPQCRSYGNVNDTCTLYFSADSQRICLATCKGDCTHSFKCPKNPAICPCQKNVASRYEARMCVPYQNLYNCSDRQVNEGNKCTSRSCIDTCHNGRCDKAGRCSCLSGFTLDQSSNECVTKECLGACVNGTCDVHGKCTCSFGFKKNGIYKCDIIDCPDERNIDYCQRECHDSGCSGAYGRCMQGECKCDQGYKKYPNKYKCRAIRCPDAGEAAYCKAECDRWCTTGWCSAEGVCQCNHGHKPDPSDKYVCNKIQCPSKESVDDEYCKTQCENSCGNGACDDRGHCECHEGFTKLATERYNCGRINCLSATAKSATALTFCKSVCVQQCTGGECDDFGFCNCSVGFKKIPDEDYRCVKIKCPSSIFEDQAHCKNRCSKTCTNGGCDQRGACECHEAFVPTNRSRVDCHHECHGDDSCSLEAILAGIIGGGFAVVVVIIVTAALMIRNRNHEERAKKELAKLPEVPLETIDEEPEYANYGQEAEAEENDLYQAFDHRHSGRGSVQ